MVSEHLRSGRMVEERAQTGARALSDWLRKCRAAVKEVQSETFVRLMEVLVGSVLLNGAEVGKVQATWASGEGSDTGSQDIPGCIGRLHMWVSELNMVPQRICKNCNSGEVEDVGHFLLRYV